MNKNSKLYCVWADSGLALHNSGRTLLCCHSRKYLQDESGKDIYLHTHALDQSLDSPTRLEIQQALEAGEQHWNCQACWDEESAGRDSRRIVSNRINRDVDVSGRNPKLLDLKLGNTCNLACRHCWPEVSSKWVKDFYEIAVRKTGQSYPEYLARWDSIQKSYDRENEPLWTQLKEYVDGAEYIDVYGAEPMLLHRLWEILGYSVESGHSRHQSIHVNTNGTIWNPRYIAILEQFRHAQIDLSIDGTDAHFDYIRYGEPWSVMAENLDRYKAWSEQHSNVNICVCITVFALNVWYLPELYRFFRDRHIGVFFNFLHMPEYLNLKAFPEPVKQAILEKLDSAVIDSRWGQEIAAVKNFLMDTARDGEKQWQDFCRNTDHLDQLRSQSFADTFPEFWSVVKPYWTQ